MALPLQETMLAYVVDGESASIQTIPVPTPEPRECLVKVSRSGICNTDLEILKGYMGFKGVLGHEVPALNHNTQSTTTRTKHRHRHHPNSGSSILRAMR